MIRRAGNRTRLGQGGTERDSHSCFFAAKKQQATSATFVVAKFYRNSEKKSSGKLKQKLP